MILIICKDILISTFIIMFTFTSTTLVCIFGPLGIVLDKSNLFSLGSCHVVAKIILQNSKDQKSSLQSPVLFLTPFGGLGGVACMKKITELWPKFFGHNFQEGADSIYPKLYPYTMDLY